MEQEVERLLAQLDGKHLPPSPVTRVPRVSDQRSTANPPTIVWASTPEPAAIPAPVVAVESSDYERVALWGRVLLGISLGLMMATWPYARSCGWPLLGYSFAVAILLLTGGWIALSAWKQRSGRAITMAFILFYWGLVLAADLTLPRIGYAANAATWRCVSQP